MISPILLLALGSAAHAEGSDELGVTQALQGDVVLKIDILAPGESFDWTAQSVHPVTGSPVDIDLALYDETGAALGVLRSGDNTGPLPVGAYVGRVQGVDLDGNGVLERVPVWDLTVGGAIGGRVSSVQWEIGGPDFSEASEFNGSFYTLVDGGSPTDTSVVELKLDGLVGRVFFVKANRVGIYHFPGRSVALGTLDEDGNQALAVAEFPIYLNPPEIATYSALVADLTDIDPAVDQCAGVAADEFPAEIHYVANSGGELHLVCDINGDGLDPSSDEDVHIQETIEAGPGVFRWDGETRDGDPVPPGNYDCSLQLAVGEFHFVANDIESSYSGLRIFEVRPTGDRRTLKMFWNDTLVQPTEVVMPNGQRGREASGPNGVSSGAYTDPIVPNVNARSWGNFTSESKGNDSLLDTWTSVYSDTEFFELRVFDNELDRDGEGLIDGYETCVIGTDPLLADTDGDGLDDRFEDEDSRSDPNDEDSDGDGVVDGLECTNDLPRRNTDNDVDVDWSDTDDDNDLVDTMDEDRNNDGDWTNDDADADGTPDWLDRDNDGDTLTNEDTNGDGDPLNDDNDLDGTPDSYDPDDDNDGVPTADEAAGDHDGDGIPDRFDPDDDNDGIPTELEGTDDTDGDGVQDNWDLDDDGDGLPTKDERDDDTDGDGDLNPFDPDDDGDGIPTRDESQTRDNDEDGLEDYLDEDSDGDGLTDGEENLVDGEFVPTDTDGDTLIDCRDEDDDNDKLPTSTEAGADTDGDGLDDHLDDDDDQDGIPTRDEVDDGTVYGSDVDVDGIPNWLDTDSDGDGVDDATEGRADVDEDGVPDYLDIPDVIDPPRTGVYTGGCDNTSGTGGGAALSLLLLPLLLRRKK